MHYKLFDPSTSSLPASERKPYFFSVAKTDTDLDPLIRGNLLNVPITGAIACGRALGADGLGLSEMLSNRAFNGESAILLGHTEGDNYGGFSPAEFADMLMHANKSRLSGMTFYMMGCHMDVFCERVASILSSRGYKNVTFVAFDENSCQVEGQNVNWYPTNLQRNDGKLQFYGAPIVRTNIKNVEEMHQFELALTLSVKELAATEAALTKTRQAIQELTEKLNLPQVEGGGSKKEMEIQLRQLQGEEKKLIERCVILQNDIHNKKLPLEVMRDEIMQEFRLGQVNSNAKEVMSFLSRHGKIIKTPMEPGAEISVSDPSVTLQAQPANKKGARVLEDVRADIKKGNDINATYVPPRLR